MEIIAKQIIGATSIPILIVGILLGVTWTDPMQFFVSVGMIVFGVIMLLLYSTISIAKSADMFVSGNRTEMSFKLDPEEDNFKSDEKKKGADLV